MKIINNDILLNKKMKEVDISSIFQNDFKKHLQLLFFEKDEIIYGQGDILNGVYILASGEIKVFYSLNNGKENILRKLKAPRIFGEIEFMVQEPAASSVQVTEDSYCLYLPLKTCRETLLNDLYFLRNIAYNLSEAIYKSNTKASINQGLSPKNRVAAYILNREENQKFICNMKEMSEFTGISERHIFRILNDFVKDEFILKEKYYYKIINKESLKEITEDFYFDE